MGTFKHGNYYIFICFSLLLFCIGYTSFHKLNTSQDAPAILGEGDTVIAVTGHQVEPIGEATTPAVAGEQIISPIEINKESPSVPITQTPSASPKPSATQKPSATLKPTSSPKPSTTQGQIQVKAQAETSDPGPGNDQEEPPFPTCPSNTTQILTFGTYNLGWNFDQLPSTQLVTVTLPQDFVVRSGTVVVLQGEGHGWDRGYRQISGPKNKIPSSWPADSRQFQPYETLSFYWGTNTNALQPIGSFIDQSPAGGQLSSDKDHITSSYNFPLKTLQPGKNYLQIKKIQPQDGGINSVMTKGVICADEIVPTTKPSSTPSPRPSHTPKPTNTPKPSVTPKVTATPTPSPLRGSIEVCVLIIDKGKNIVDGKAIPDTVFRMKGKKTKTSVADYAGVIDTSSFTTPLGFTSDIIGSDTRKDSSCIKYTNLPIGSYYYDRQEISGGNWEEPQYNDLYTETISTLEDFYTYDEQLFDTNPANDENRNHNSDGHIGLTESRPDRRLVILNQYSIGGVEEPLPTSTATPTTLPTLTPTITSSPTYTPIPTPTATIAPTPTPTIVNMPPSVNAGPTQTIPFGEPATHNGTVQDDGNPNPPGTVNTSWAVTSGPGTVTFTNPHPLQPEVTFPDPGVYVFELCATDSEYEVCDTTQITVFAPPTNTPSPTQSPTPSSTPAPSEIPVITQSVSPTPNAEIVLSQDLGEKEQIDSTTESIPVTLTVKNEGDVEIQNIQVYTDLDSSGSFKENLEEITEHKAPNEDLVINESFDSKTDTEHLAETTRLQPQEQFVITYQAIVQKTDGEFVVPAEVQGTTTVGLVSDEDTDPVALTVVASTATPKPKTPTSTPTQSQNQPTIQNPVTEVVQVIQEDYVAPVIRYIYKQLPFDQDIGGVNESDQPEIERLVEAGIPVSAGFGVGLMILVVVAGLKIIDMKRKSKNYTPLPDYLTAELEGAQKQGTVTALHEENKPDSTSQQSY